MIKHIICWVHVFLFVSVYGQNTADFQMFDSRKNIMCYTERSNGIPKKNTEVTFKNNSTCDGECLYIWESGEPNSEQNIIKNKDDFEYTYTQDGRHTANLQLINRASIPDSIYNQNIISVIKNSETSDSVDIQITYSGGDNVEKIAQLRIDADNYDSPENTKEIVVYSPLVSGNNFTYEIDDPSTMEQPAPLQSFSYNLQVDRDNFKPHKLDYWTYYWEIYNSNENNEPIKQIHAFNTDSLNYLFTFPLENYEPGYYVKLKIALDSSKFEDEEILNYHDLWECVASQHIIIPVTDYFFTEDTRTEHDIENRDAQIPNIFTPGGNDENEKFYFNTNGIDLFTVYVYNSWGDLVYTKEAQTITWAGEDNAGRDCPSGTYYYVIFSDKKDERHETGGYIHLFRQE